MCSQNDEVFFMIINAGFITILNYILNYYHGVDTEVRDPRGFTALIKAGLQGREECVSALLMHGKFSNLNTDHDLDHLCQVYPKQFPDLTADERRMLPDDGNQKDFVQRDIRGKAGHLICELSCPSLWD